MLVSDLSGKQVGESIDLKLFFRGNRDYIQGALVIGRLAEYLYLKGHTDRLRLTSCKFTILIETGVRAFFSEQTGQIASCTLQFKSGDNDLHQFWLYPDIKTRPPRVEDTSSLLNIDSLSISKENPLSGSVEFHGCQDFEKLLLNLFAFNKRMHLESSSGVHTVLFTGIRGASVPVSRAFSSGKFEIENRIKNGANGQIQSLSLVTISPKDETLDALKFQMSFGYSIPHNEDTP